MIKILFLLLSISIANAQGISPPGPIDDGTGCLPSGSSGNVLTDNGSGGCIDINSASLTALINPATTLLSGAVIPDGTIITVDGSGNITVPKTSTSIFGVIKTGTGLTSTAGVVTPTFGTAINQVAEGGVITAGGPTGSSTAIPTITYNAAGQLTAVSTNVVIAPANTLSGTTLHNTVVSSSLTSVGNRLAYSGASPVVSACGTGSPAIDANATDTSGTVTIGTVATTCTVTFAIPYVTYNHCRVTSQSAVSGLAYSYTKSAIIVAASVLGGDVFDYNCDGS